MLQLAIIMIMDLLGTSLVSIDDKINVFHSMLDVGDISRQPLPQDRQPNN